MDVCASWCGVDLLTSDAGPSPWSTSLYFTGIRKRGIETLPCIKPSGIVIDGTALIRWPKASKPIVVLGCTAYFGRDKINIICGEDVVGNNSVTWNNVHIGNTQTLPKKRLASMFRARSCTVPPVILACFMETYTKNEVIQRHMTTMLCAYLVCAACIVRCIPCPLWRERGMKLGWIRSFGNVRGMAFELRNRCYDKYQSKRKGTHKIFHSGNI